MVGNGVRSDVRALDEVVDEGHDELRGAATEVTPAGCEAVGGADDLAVEHGAHPVLARHESSQREADEEPHGDEPRHRVHRRHGIHRRRDHHDQKRTPVARPHDVAHRAHQQPRQDRT